MNIKSVEFVHGVGYLHISCDPEGFGATWCHVVARSERHADRLIALLNWYPYANGPGYGFRDTWYCARTKRLYSRSGRDI